MMMNFDKLVQINSDVNIAVTYMTDEEVWGEAERWGLPKSLKGRLYDDCDGYTFEKIKRVSESGFNGQYYPMCCLTREGNPEHDADHMVLCVELGDIFWILDNRLEHVQPIQDVRMQKWWLPEKVGSRRVINGLWYRVNIQDAV